MARNSIRRAALRVALGNLANDSVADLVQLFFGQVFSFAKPIHEATHIDTRAGTSFPVCCNGVWTGARESTLVEGSSTQDLIGGPYEFALPRPCVRVFSFGRAG